MNQGFDEGQAEVVLVTFQVTRIRAGKKKLWTALTKQVSITFNPERGQWRVTGIVRDEEITTHGDTVNAAILAFVRLATAGGA